MRNMNWRVTRWVVMVAVTLAVAPAVAQEVVVTLETNDCEQDCHVDASETRNGLVDRGLSERSADLVGTVLYNACVADDCGKQ